MSSIYSRFIWPQKFMTSRIRATTLECLSESEKAAEQHDRASAAWCLLKINNGRWWNGISHSDTFRSELTRIWGLFQMELGIESSWWRFRSDLQNILYIFRPKTQTVLSAAEMVNKVISIKIEGTSEGGRSRLENATLDEGLKSWFNCFLIIQHKHFR